MSERVMGILRRLRARLLAVRAAEAFAVGSAAGGLIAAALMASRVVAGPLPVLAVVLAGLPLLAGGLLAALGRARRAVSRRGLLAWYVVALSVGSGAAGVAWTLTGVPPGAGKNWLALLVPLGGLAASGLVLARGASLAGVAAVVDVRAALKERLSTAYELHRAGADSPFAGEVHRQVEAAAEGRGLRRVRLWDRSRATAGALGLALLAVAVVLPIEVLESPQARQRRQWQQVAPQAAAALDDPLAGLDGEALAAAGLAGQIERLQAVAGALRAARAEDAEKWAGQVVELDRLAEALRRALRSGRLDPAAARRLQELIQAVERAAALLADGMPRSEAERLHAQAVDAASVPGPATRPAPRGWTQVYNPDYARFVRTRPAESEPTAAGPPPPSEVPFDRAWREAQRRASEALERQEVPSAYRRLVRDFFAAEG